MTTLLQMFSFLARGGWIMAPIAVCSVYSLTLIVERFLALRQSAVLPKGLLKQISTLIREKKTAELLAVCQTVDNPLTRVLQSGLEVIHLDRATVVEEFERAGKKEVLLMEKNLTALGSLAASGPLLGLFGTVTGMIQTFAVIRVVGVGNPLELSAGISEALLSTAGGMVVGIPALIFQRYFLRKTDEYASELESVAYDALQYLKDGR